MGLVFTYYERRKAYKIEEILKFMDKLEDGSS